MAAEEDFEVYLGGQEESSGAAAKALSSGSGWFVDTGSIGRTGWHRLHGYARPG